MFSTYDTFIKNIKVFSKYCKFENNVLHLFISNRYYKLIHISSAHFNLHEIYFLSDDGHSIWPSELINYIVPTYDLNDNFKLYIDYYPFKNTFTYHIISRTPHIIFDINDLTALNIADDIFFNKLPSGVLTDYLCEKSLVFRQVKACSELLKEKNAKCI